MNPMPYIARVELRGTPSYDDYDKLHTAMARAYFTRTIVGGDGTKYNLPHATYQSASYATVTGARDAAQTAATSVWTDVLLIVSGSETAWYLSMV
jgi:hypothetical protein